MIFLAAHFNNTENITGLNQTGSICVYDAPNQRPLINLIMEVNFFPLGTTFFPNNYDLLLQKMHYVSFASVYYLYLQAQSYLRAYIFTQVNTGLFINAKQAKSFHKHLYLKVFFLKFLFKANNISVSGFTKQEPLAFQHINLNIH